MGRGIMAGITSESSAPMWLLARIAPPSRGKFSAPKTLVPYPNLTMGRTTVNLKKRYQNMPGSLVPSGCPRRAC